MQSQDQATLGENPITTVTAFTSGVTPERCSLFSAIMGESPMFGNPGDSEERVTLKERLLDVGVNLIMSVPTAATPVQLGVTTSPV